MNSVTQKACVWLMLLPFIALLGCITTDTPDNVIHIYPNTNDSDTDVDVDSDGDVDTDSDSDAESSDEDSSELRHRQGSEIADID